MLRSDFTLLRRYIGLHCFLSLSFLTPKPMYNTIWLIFLDAIWTSGVLLYDINLRATHTTILSTKGVTIPIYLVSSTMDSIKQCVVLFKAVTIPTSDPKSEFLVSIEFLLHRTCRLPWTTLYTWNISHALITTYHPYCHSLSALTEYLKQKLHHQQAKWLGHSPPTQVEQSVQLERNKSYCFLWTFLLSTLSYCFKCRYSFVTSVVQCAYCLCVEQ